MRFVRPGRGAGRRRERGQSLVEFSMTVPLFLLFLLGLLEFGMVFDHVLTIGYATREGARTGSALANGSKMATESLWHLQRRRLVRRGGGRAGPRLARIPVQGDLANVSQIRIYKAAASGDELGPVNVWVPGTGPTVDGSQLSFSRSSYGWTRAPAATAPPIPTRSACPSRTRTTR